VLAGVYWSKRWWRWWWQLDYWSYKSCIAPVRSSPPTNQHSVCLSACPVQVQKFPWLRLLLFWWTSFMEQFSPAYGLRNITETKKCLRDGWNVTTAVGMVE